MSTSPIIVRRCARRGAVALIMSAILLPTGSALAQDAAGPVGDRPAEYFSNPRQPSRAPMPVGDAPADYFRDTPATPRIAPPLTSHAAEDSGFDWTSAGIGAGAAGVLIVVSLIGATAASRLHVRTMRS